MQIVPLSFEELVLLNEFVVAQTGGDGGILNSSNIRNCCDLLTNVFYGIEQFQKLFNKAAAFLECIAGSHGFVNANKRTSIAAVNLLLHRNGWQFSPDNEVVEISKNAAKHDIKLIDLEAWITKCSRPSF